MVRTTGMTLGTHTDQTRRGARSSTTCSPRSARLRPVVALLFVAVALATSGCQLSVMWGARNHAADGDGPVAPAFAAAVSTGPPPPPRAHPELAPLTFGPGATGPKVLALQERLVALGYWLGVPDAVYGDTTQQAVYAYQKAAGIQADGVAGPDTLSALNEGAVPQPRSTSGYVVEVDLAKDLLMVVQDGKLQYVLNTSTGGGYTYTSDGVTAVAVTPTGQFEIYRQVDGMVVDSLGQLWRPKFFTGGFAIHGDTYVPGAPVSHGCVRVSNEAIDWIWSNDVMPIGTSVWVY